MGATFSRVKQWSNGEVLTAADLNAEFDNILNNLDPTGVDDTSSTLANMQATADPYPSSSESLATNLRGEIRRIRYLLAQITGESYWYIDPDNTLLNTGTLTKDAVSADTISEKTSANGVAVDGLTIKDGGISDGTNLIKLKVVSMGDWNMDSTATLAVAHGLTLAKIRGVTGAIRNDADDTYYPIPSYDGSGGTPDAGVTSIDATNVNLARETGGPFDAATFDSTSYNRGFLYIEYIV